MKHATALFAAAFAALTLQGATPMPDFTPAFPTGAPNDAYAQYFKGQSYLARLTERADQTGVPIANVTFEPGCRNNWHRHTGGQILVCVAGEGLYQERGKPARHLRPGDVVEIPPDTDHWHGATADRWFAHLSVECHPETNKNTWLEPVSDADYAAAQPRPAAPKHLTPREAALARVSGRAAAGDIPGLKRALAAALDAGLTVNETKEVLVQLYAYAGFPRCLNAHAAFAQVLAERKAAGKADPEGPAPQALPAGADRERLGREKRAFLFGGDPNAPEADWQRFAPGAEQFLKEHLFCDIFARGLLTDKERELCTVSMLACIPGAEAQLASHRKGAERMGNAPAALDEATDLARAAQGGRGE